MLALTVEKFLLDLGPRLELWFRRTRLLALDPLRTRRIRARRFALFACVFPLAVGAGVELRAAAFHLAVRTRAALHAVALLLPVRTPLHPHDSCPSPTVALPVRTPIRCTTICPRNRRFVFLSGLKEWKTREKNDDCQLEWIKHDSTPTFALRAPRPWLQGPRERFPTVPEPVHISSQTCPLSNPSSTTSSSPPRPR